MYMMHTRIFNIYENSKCKGRVYGALLINNQTKLLNTQEYTIIIISPAVRRGGGY